MSEDEAVGAGSRTNSATQLNNAVSANTTANNHANNHNHHHHHHTTGSNSLASVGSSSGGAAAATAAAATSSTSSSSKRSRFSSLAQYATRLHVSRTTVVLFAVTVAFVLSFFPALAVMVVRTVVKDFDRTQSMGSLVATKIFTKFNFINNAINPIIYSFLNINFRRQARKAVEKLLCCLRRRRRRQMPQKADSDRSTKKEFLHV